MTMTYLLATFSRNTFAQSAQLAPGATEIKYVRLSISSNSAPASPIEIIATAQSLLAFTVLTVSRASSVKPSTMIPTVTLFSRSIGRISRG